MQQIKFNSLQTGIVCAFALALTVASSAFAQCVGDVCKAPSSQSAAACAPCARAYAYDQTAPRYACQTQACGNFQPFGGFFRSLFGCQYQFRSCAAAPCARLDESGRARGCSTCSGATCLADPVNREFAPGATTDKEFATGGYLVDRTTGKKYAFDPGDESFPPAWKELDSESCEECEECEDCEDCAPCDAVQTTEIERRLLNAINRARARFGRQSCRADGNLFGWARLNSYRQASYCRLGHWTGHSYEIAGAGYATPEAAVNGWIGSAPHNAILFGAHWTRVGVSVYRGSDGRLYWTATFGN